MWLLTKLFDKNQIKIFTNMSIKLSLVVDTQWLLTFEEEAQKRISRKLRYVLSDLAAKEKLCMNIQAT